MQTTIFKLLEQKFKDAFAALDFPSDSPVVLQEASKPEFGDYQVNGVMGVAKKLKVNPRELAAKIVDKVKTEGFIEKLEIAGPGFINVTLSNKYLSQLNKDLLKVTADQIKKIVVDYSSPNLAKEMHVGHLRSTIIGDALVHMYEYLGHEVIKRNHVGDWGTQFGMLVAHLVEVKKDHEGVALELSDLEEFYRKSKQRFDEDEEFAARSREYVVKLQSGDAKVLALWKQFVEVSLEHCQKIYDELNVELTHDDAVGESAYNDLLPVVVKDLIDKGIVVDSQGAKCIFFEPGELSTKDETPFIVQKKDGAYLYSTTDIAAVYDRINNLHANRLVYVIDSRQSLHMQQLFAVAKKAKMIKPDTLMEHVAFGTMLGEDNKPFKTRSGSIIKLTDLIDESIKRATAIVRERNSDWSEEEISKLAEALGIASLKYADLSKNRLSDYIFSFDKMLSFEGNTAPYMLYAYVRILSIFRKMNLGADRGQTQKTGSDLCCIKDYLGKQIMVTEVQEHNLAMHLAKFADRLLIAAEENYPHHICQYIYELAVLFMQFYENCPIIKATSKEQQASRLALAALTAEVLKKCLNILGLSVVDRM